MKTTILLIINLPLLGLTSCKQVQKQQKAQEAEKELHESLAHFKKSQSDSYEKTGEISSDKGATDKLIQAAKKMEESGVKSKAAEGASVRIWMNLMTQEEAILTKGADHIAVGSDYSKIKKKEDIAKMSAAVRKYEAINQATIKGINGGWFQEVEDKMNDEEISSTLIKRNIVSLKSGFNKIKPNLLLIRKTDLALCAGLLEQHAVLTESYGKWVWDAGEEVPSFTEDAEDAHLDRYNNAAEKIQKAVDEQTAAQRKLIQNR